MTHIKNTLFLFLFFACCSYLWVILNYSAPITEECNQVFTSPLYTHYYQTLKTFLYDHPLYEQVKRAPATPFNAAMQALLKNIEGSLETPQKQRSCHETFVSHLRLLALQKNQDKDSPSQYLFEDLIHWIFLRADFKAVMQQYLYSYIPLPTENLLNSIQMAQKKLKTHAYFTGIQTESSIEDQFFQGNLPLLVSTKKTTLIRLGQPCNQHSRFFWWKSPTVYPEFLCFLQLQPSHFYVNLMKRKGLEGKASLTIEALEEQFRQLYVITLDKNSSFYWQKHPYDLESWESATFKKTFSDQLFASKGHYFWSKQLNPLIWEKDLQNILNLVHLNYFNNQISLNRQERQDFIELTYLAILNTLVSKWNPASMNITCRQGMDRGPSLMVLWLMQENQLTAPEIETLLLTPPLLIRKRPCHDSRINRFISAAKYSDLNLIFYS